MILNLSAPTTILFEDVLSSIFKGFYNSENSWMCIFGDEFKSYAEFLLNR